MMKRPSKVLSKSKTRLKPFQCTKRESITFTIPNKDREKDKRKFFGTDETCKLEMIFFNDLRDLRYLLCTYHGTCYFFLRIGNYGQSSAKFVHFEVGCAALYCYVTKSYFVIVSCWALPFPSNSETERVQLFVVGTKNSSHPPPNLN